MNQRSTRRSLFALPVLALLSVGCSSPGGEGSDSGGIDNDTPLSDLDSLLKDAPDNAKLDELGKADAVYPKLYTELLTQQSPVRNQARRGVCSIFATNGLMEHLYLKAGNLPNPDFSEQFLQWSVKKRSVTSPTPKARTLTRTSRPSASSAS